MVLLMASAVQQQQLQVSNAAMQRLPLNISRRPQQAASPQLQQQLALAQQP
jgi:hypothetical protein